MNEALGDEEFDDEIEDEFAKLEATTTNSNS